MNLFQTNFLTKMSNLLKEAFKFKKYKAMNPALAIFTGIFMIPWVIASFALTASLAFLGFTFSVLSSPVKYIHEITTTEGKNVKHASQAIIYLISWPTVLFLYILMSALLLLILPTYAILAITTYVWSLGGFKFHIFPHEVDDISIEVTKRYFALPLVFVIICFVIYLTAGIHGTTIFTKLWMLELEKWFGFYYAPVFLAYQAVQTSFAFLYSIIGFANRAKKVEKIEE